MKKLRVGVVGLGMGRAHIEGYLKAPDVEVAALADTDPARLQDVGDKYGVAARYTDALEMFRKAGLDAVSIATPNKFHCPLTLAALRQGLHVLCEKPMAMSVAEAESMRRAAEKAGRNLMINFSFRFTNASFALRQQVQSGAIGDIYFGRTVWHRRRGIPRFGGWFGQKDLSGGGPLIDLGVHRIDLALWLMGHPEPVAVSGSAYNVLARERARREKKSYTVEDLACGLVKFRNGATLIVEASWALNINENEHMVTALYGDRGGLVQKNVNGTYEFVAEIYTEEGGNLYTKRLDHAAVPAPSSYAEFIASIREKRPPLAPAEDGVKVQKILNGLYTSAETGREVVFR
jgi:predicted dehydrogenase